VGTMKQHACFKTAILILTLCAWARPVAAETGKFNLHLEGAAAFGLAGWQSEDLGVGVSGAGRLEFPLAEWLGIEVGGGYLQFFDGGNPDGYELVDDSTYLVNVSAGARFRIVNDEGGYWWAWSADPAHIGNLWGNLWADVHFDYYRTGDLNRVGGDIGVGAEFSLVNGLQIGPLVRVHYVFQPNSANERDSQDAWLLLAGVSFSVAIPPGGLRMTDKDGDGIYDPYDRCPDKAEDRDRFQDTDGCPDVDNDKDGVPDQKDNCPAYQEDMDGYLDSDGCPDPDNDSDGLPDNKDPCPAQSEDKDGYLDEDGCPDEDNDNDGIKDDKDACPNQPETINGIKDEDGCPERDIDEDGVADSVDKCPSEPETVNGVNDEDGCPDISLVKVIDNKILMENRVFFDIASARVKSSARAILSDLGTLIKNHPEYVRISLEGHADATGDREFNFDLSEQRANSVKRFLVKMGVEPERLVIRAFGSNAPWVEEKDGSGERRNRRVEVRIEAIDESRASAPVSKGIREAVSRKRQEQSGAAGENGAMGASSRPKDKKDKSVGDKSKGAEGTSK
jgi:outer membrane protein OmpA-like peptidoglycan-associated protein